MKVMDRIEDVGETEMSGADLLQPLVQDRANGAQPASAISGIAVAQLVALSEDGLTPLLMLPGKGGSAAVRGRSTVDLHGAHIGREVVVAFEAADMAQPIVLGILRGASDRSIERRPGQVDVDADGERLVVSAKNQIVLRCGKASITLTKAGKVLIEGVYVSSRSRGVNRVKGGSIQLN